MSRPAGARPLKTTRVRRRMLQTPVIRYQHRKTGQRVTLVGTVHAGEAAYYEKLRAMVTNLEAAGALVHYEQVSPAAGEEWAAASGDEHAARHVWGDQGRDALQAACRYLGWVPQGTALICSPTWQSRVIQPISAP